MMTTDMNRLHNVGMCIGPSFLHGNIEVNCMYYLSILLISILIMFIQGSYPKTKNKLNRISMQVSYIWYCPRQLHLILTKLCFIQMNKEDIIQILN